MYFYTNSHWYPKKEYSVNEEPFSTSDYIHKSAGEYRYNNGYDCEHKHVYKQECECKS